MSTLNQLSTPQDSTMKALIIYDDFASAAKVNTTLQHSAQNVDFAMQWSIRPWQVNLLKFPPTADEALTEAIDAHLIAFAGRSAQSLPFWLQHWLEHWAKCRRIEHAALAVIVAGNAEVVAAAAKPDLPQFAERHGLSFVFDDGGVAGDKTASFIRSLHEHNESTNPTPEPVPRENPENEYMTMTNCTTQT
ncbi:MAG: hypothetical protein ACLQAH_14930 [Limisphaerales bacterium]